MWLPVAHTYVDRYCNVLLQQTGLRHGEVSQRTLADEAVAMRDLVDRGLWQRPTACYVAQVFRNFIQRLGSAMCQQQNRGAFPFSHRAVSCCVAAAYSRTNRTAACTLSTGVPGTIPCPTLKICPGRPAACERMLLMRLRSRS